MINNHIPVMLEEVKIHIPNNKKINILDATFGGGGYSKSILEEFDVENLIAIDRDPISNLFAKELIKKYKNFKLLNGCFSRIAELISSEKNMDNKQFDIIIFDLGISSNQLNDPSRGFSFMHEGPLDMGMGNNNQKASEIINNYSESKLADIIYKFGEERLSRRIARNIVAFRKLKLIENTKELSNLIKKSFNIKQIKKLKIDPATKTFQALRIYINDELNELTIALNKSLDLLKVNGKIIIVSFQSLEDRIVKDFLNHNSGKRWRSSRHYPELTEDGPITLELITKKPIRPSEQEIYKNPRSRSAKLRVGEKIN